MIPAWNPYGHEHTLDAMNNAIGAEDVLARICCESGNYNDPSKSRKKYGKPYGLIRTMINKHVYVCIHTMKEYTWRHMMAFPYLIDLEGLFIQSSRAQTSQQAAILHCFSVPIALSDCLSLYQTSVVLFLFQRLNYLSPVSPWLKSHFPYWYMYI